MLGLLLRLFRSSVRTSPRATARRTSDPSAQHGLSTRSAVTGVLTGKCHVIDGDTIIIGNTRIRLSGIDAPELDQPFGKMAKYAMISLCNGNHITAHILEGVSYDRVVAKCSLPDGTDLSAALVAQGLALDWARFSGGIYRHLEPAGVRKKLWRVAAKHRGQLTSS